MIRDHYKIEIAMSATLNSKIVEDIIRREVEAQTGRKVEKIHVIYDGTKFSGYNIVFTPDAMTSYKSSNEFVEQRWK